MSLFGVKERKEIVELNILIDSLQKKILEMKDREEQLLNIIQKRDIEIANSGNSSKSPYDKQLEKISLEFDKVKSENFNLKTENDTLKLNNLSLITENNEKIEEYDEIINNLKIENQFLRLSKKTDIVVEEPRYKILIKDLYSARKYYEFKKVCDDLGYIYMSELENFDFEKLKDNKISETKINNAKNEYIKFKSNEFSLEIKEYLMFGHKVSKIFFRYRKFISYLEKMKISFISQLENFDFESLKAENFTPEQIEKLKEKTIEYNKLRKI